MVGLNYKLSVAQFNTVKFLDFILKIRTYTNIAKLLTRPNKFSYQKFREKKKKKPQKKNNFHPENLEKRTIVSVTF